LLVATMMALLCGAAPAVSQETGVELESTLLRTWTIDTVTIVDGLVNVPLSILDAGTTNAYRFELAVFDSEGNRLYSDGWAREVSDRTAAYSGAGSSLLEPFRLGLRSGTYEVELRAFPTDAPDMGVVQRVPIEGFAEQPRASDLFLASRIEEIDETAGGGNWSVTHQGYGIGASAAPTVLPAEPEIYYYLELYGMGPESWTASVAAEVVRPDGSVAYRTASTDVDVGVEGQVLPFTGHLPLAGLPPGEYQLVLVVESEDAPVRRAASFRMAEPVLIATGSDPSYETDYFASLPDEELIRTFDGVGYLLTDAERVSFDGLPPEAKRRFLAQYFASRDPDAATPGNAYLDEYVERIGIIRLRYSQRVGTEDRPPWTTPRGRLFLMRGQPDDMTVNNFPADQGDATAIIGSGGAFGGEPPYEIWAYRQGNVSWVYLFVQDNRFNAWRLIFTTDPNMSYPADWVRRTGEGAIQDLRNYGISPAAAASGLDN
jgi:GWxTD domain-containing protein